MPRAPQKSVGVEIVTIGSELTAGRVVNTNVAFVSRALVNRGYEVRYQTTVADVANDIVRALRQAAGRAALVFATGGLGPTADDLTTQAVARLARKKIVRDRKALADIQTLVKNRRRALTAADLKMCSVPAGAGIFRNRNGMACGYHLRVGRARLIVAPGVPAELTLMLEKEILPFLAKKMPAPQHFAARIFRIAGLPEAQVDRVVARLRLGERFPGVEVSFTLFTPEVHVQVGFHRRESEARMRKTLAAVEKLFRETFRECFVGIDEETLSQIVHALLLEKGLTLAVAESCTGGLLAKMLTDHPGSSAYFLGGVICYSNESKVRDLAVPEKMIARHGAVSTECAGAMATGVRRRFASDLGVAITGIAGPDGGTPEKPVGTVHIALDFRGQISHRRHYFHGDRARIRHFAQYTALQMLREGILRSIHSV